MATYGQIYSAQFDSFNDNLLTYRILIYKKDYSGSSSELLLSGEPAVQEWQEDDPLAPIKGCTLKVSFISDGVALTDFYSDDDNGFKIELYRNETDELLFTGFILQDSCEELQVDFFHTIQITATDNLGLLKDVKIDLAAINYGTPDGREGVVFSSVDLNVIFFDYIPLDTLNIQPGQVFNLSYSGYSRNYTLVRVAEYVSGLGYKLYVVEETDFIAYSIPATISWKIAIPLTGFINLATILRLCYLSTGLELGTNLVCELTSQMYHVSFLDDIYIQGNTLLNSNEYISCYDFMEIVFKRFKFTTFQSGGLWWIVRFNELQLERGAPGVIMRYHSYDKDFNYLGASDSNPNRLFELYNDTNTLTGVLKSIERPNQYCREYFNYENPDEILHNISLSKLGGLRQSYTVGSDTYYEYDLPADTWRAWDEHPSPSPDTFIRVIVDGFNKEADRYIVVVGSVYDSTLAKQSNDIYVSHYDIINWNFSYKTSNSQGGSINNYWHVRLQTETDIYYLNNDAEWILWTGGARPAVLYNIPAGDNSNSYHTTNFRSKEIPADGVLSLFLTEATASSSNETHYNNFNFSIEYKVSGQYNITGHYHKDSISQTIKNNWNEEIFIDQAPRYSMKGALYEFPSSPSFPKLINAWQLNAIYYPSLGIITTKEDEYFKWRPRTKFQGSFRKITTGDTTRVMNMFSFFYMPSNQLIYILGSLRLDYKNNIADFTLYEMVDRSNNRESFNNNNLYEFNYLYNK